MCAGSDSDDSGNHEILQRNGISLQQVLGRGMFGKVYKGKAIVLAWSYASSPAAAERCTCQVQ